ncbi:ankyrin repeat domain-containing protein 27-like isoform X1 [Cataglyphis hispanica]|uniref:ankyrin repeat domain-containing protein 27-like isoform X1 n=1 Tax=Cataglyphis hispanica TaxID=1086592 RepID=UPI002180255B|nr:ankyrin repeat domain-containing protein 27-like isoform X1 [Cataglyphis hispanica]
MNTEYDEDLAENRFLHELRNEYKTTFQRIVQEGWIICVPRTGSFSNRELREDEVNAHILIPKQDFSAARFDSLNGREVLLVDRVLTVKYDDSEQNSTRLLFEEIFYSKDLHKYCIWCIEQPLDANMCVSDNCVNVITSFQEAVHFLQVELLDKQLHDNFETKIKDFLYVNKNLERKSMQVQRDLVHELYTDCLKMLLENTSLKEKVSGSKQYYWNIRVSLETYILYALREVLLRSLSTCTAVEDAYLNKIIRNLDGILLSDLRIRSDLEPRVRGGKMELSRLDCYVTVLGKIECLRRTVNYVSRGTSSVSSDDLLPILVFLVINVGLSNWMAQLFFMRQFRLSTNSAYEADETCFLITSLEAAIEHIKSGVICEGEKYAINSNKNSQLTDKSDCSSVNYLFACVKNGNLSEVERILTYERSNQDDEISLCHPLCTCASCERNWTNHRELNACPRDDRGLTSLHIAVLYDQIMIVDFLLDRGTDVNIADSDGLTPLHYACIKGHQNILLLMLHANADPTVTDSQGNTPLHLAVDRGHDSCVKALLYLSEHMKVSINANAINDNGDTPLHLAARWAYLAIVGILLEYGANSRLTNRKGQTPLTITYSESIAELLKRYANDLRNNIALSQKKHATLTQSRQSIPFQGRCWATFDNLQSLPTSHPKNSANAQHRMMDKLLAAIIDGDVCLACYYLGLEVYRSERLPGSRASLCHHPLCDCECCSALGERKFQRERRQRVLAINACNSLGETALHVASATGRVEMVQLLLDAGANVNAITKSEGRTPLHLACLNDRVDAAKLLLYCGTCDLDAKDHNGDTSLHLATIAGNVKLVGLLVRYGANTNVRNAQNKSPLRQAEELQLSVVFSTNHASILKILKQNTQPVGD